MTPEALVSTARADGVRLELSPAVYRPGLIGHYFATQAAFRMA
jgi:hypothetical protein